MTSDQANRLTLVALQFGLCISVQPNKLTLRNLAGQLQLVAGNKISDSAQSLFSGEELLEFRNAGVAAQAGMLNRWVDTGSAWDWEAHDAAYSVR